MRHWLSGAFWHSPVLFHCLRPVRSAVRLTSEPSLRNAALRLVGGRGPGVVILERHLPRDRVRTAIASSQRASAGLASVPWLRSWGGAREHHGVRCSALSFSVLAGAVWCGSVRLWSECVRPPPAGSVLSVSERTAGRVGRTSRARA